jgi:hypothetical protein
MIQLNVALQKVVAQEYLFGDSVNEQCDILLLSDW